MENNKGENKHWKEITQKNTKLKQNYSRILMSCEMGLVPPNAHLSMEREKINFYQPSPAKLNTKIPYFTEHTKTTYILEKHDVCMLTCQLQVYT